MNRPCVHLISPASPAGRRLAQLGFDDVREFRARVGQALGGEYRVTADLACLRAEEDDCNGGRTDDARRARDIERALADDNTAGIVAVCGGAWFTRILRRIDFGVLDRRKARVSVIGSSEITSLVNIVARHRRGVGIHDVMPIFVLDKARPKRTAMRAFDEYWTDVAGMIAGRGSTRPMTGTLLSGRLPRRSVVRAVGGNLTLVTSLIGGPFERYIRTQKRWLALEDVHEKPHELDRMLAQLRLAGLLDRIEGLLLGDFHRGREDLRCAVESLLRFHLPDRRVPVVSACNFGHIWPAAPLPLNEPLEVIRCGRDVRIPYNAKA